MGSLSKEAVAEAQARQAQQSRPQEEEGFMQRVLRSATGGRTMNSPSARSAYVDYAAEENSAGREALPFTEWLGKQARSSKK